MAGRVPVRAVRRAGGEAALIVFTALITGLAAFLLWRAAALKDRPAWLFAFLLCLGAAATCDRFVPRPQIFTYLCLALLLERLAAIRRGASAWSLIPLQVFWTNVHGPLWGLFFAVPLLLGGSVPGMSVKRRLALCAALTAASCIHPQGFHVLTDYVTALGGEGLFRQTIRGWLPLTDPKQEGIPQTNAVWALIVSGAAILTTALLCPDARQKWGVILCLLAVILAPFAAIRNRDLLAMALVPLAALLWADFPAGLRTLRRPVSTVLALAALTVTVIPAFGLTFPGPGFPAGTNRYEAFLPPRLSLSTESFPAAAVDFLSRHPVGTRIFNAYDCGGYLVDRLRDRRIFIDGRYFVYGEPAYLEYLLTRDGGAGAPAVLDRTETDLLLIRYPQPDGYQGLADLVLRRPDWALVFWDDDTLVLLRRSAGPADWLAAHEYRWLIPTVPEPMRSFEYWTVHFRELVLEARHAAAEAPAALLPRILLGLTFEYNGQDGDAAVAYREALFLKPDHGPALEGLKRIETRRRNGFPDSDPAQAPETESSQRP